jgi:predicted transcriptional regulator
MDYNVITAAKMPELIEQVNLAIQDGWLPMEGGFQVQNTPESSTRYLQAMVKVYPWSIKTMSQMIGAAAAGPAQPVIDAKEAALPASAKKPGASKKPPAKKPAANKKKSPAKKPGKK